MNRKRTSRQKRSISTFEVPLAIVAAIVIIAGAVNFSVLRNEQVALDRKIDKVYQSAKRLDIETNSILVEIDRKINRFAVKSDLREQNSVMRERPAHVVEKVSPVDRPVVHSGEMQQNYPNLFIYADLGD